ncbi:MAG: RnfABCDGE type electron transport complex subunit D [bacterium]
MAKDEENILEVSISPHIHAGVDTGTIMRDVLLALAVPGCASIYFFGLSAFWLILVSSLTALVTEWVFQKLTRRKIRIQDLSCLVTGVLLAFCVPPGLPLWTMAVGSMFSILVGKELFGGIGYNVFNPALVGRAILLASWPVGMTSWRQPLRMITGPVDAISSATPLSNAKLSGIFTPFKDLLLGQVSGSLGETSALSLLIGAVYLFYRRVIDWRIPVSYLAAVSALAWLLRQDPVFHLLSGGLFLGAFFMATDYTTSPITPRGKLIFGAGCGLITVLIRLYGGFPEGVCYAILFMNSLTPLIEQFTEPRPYGKV